MYIKYVKLMKQIYYMSMTIVSTVISIKYIMMWQNKTIVCEYLKTQYVNTDNCEYLNKSHNVSTLKQFNKHTAEYIIWQYDIKMKNNHGI